MYSPETQAILDAVISGDVCPDCGAPNHLRHFDECPRHPENASKPMAYAQTGSYCEPCLYFSSCPTHDPDGSLWRARQPKGTPYFDADGTPRVT